MKSLRVRCSWWKGGTDRSVAWHFWWRRMNTQFCMRPPIDKLWYFELCMLWNSPPTTQTRTLSMAFSQAMPADVKLCLVRWLACLNRFMSDGVSPTSLCKPSLTKELLHYLRHICGTRRDPSGFNQPRSNFSLLCGCSYHSHVNHIDCNLKRSFSANLTCCQVVPLEALGSGGLQMHLT